MKGWGGVIGALVVLFISGAIVYTAKKNGGTLPIKTPTPTPQAGVQLPKEQQPKIELTFSKDAHFVTVDLSNLHADKLEYNLIYDATVKNNKIQTGVNSTADIKDKSTFSQKQLLGSESSGKFTYHENIQNANMDLTLRDSSGRSIFTATYPFTVSPGASSTLTPSE